MAFHGGVRESSGALSTRTLISCLEVSLPPKPNYRSKTLPQMASYSELGFNVWSWLGQGTFQHMVLGIHVWPCNEHFHISRRDEELWHWAYSFWGTAGLVSVRTSLSLELLLDLYLRNKKHARVQSGMTERPGPAMRRGGWGSKKYSYSSMFYLSLGKTFWVEWAGPGTMGRNYMLSVSEVHRRFVGGVFFFFPNNQHWDLLLL